MQAITHAPDQQEPTQHSRTLPFSLYQLGVPPDSLRFQPANRFPHGHADGQLLALTLQSYPDKRRFPADATRPFELGPLLPRPMVRPTPPTACIALSRLFNSPEVVKRLQFLANLLEEIALLLFPLVEGGLGPLPLEHRLGGVTRQCLTLAVLLSHFLVGFLGSRSRPARPGLGFSAGRDRLPATCESDRAGRR